MTNPILSGGPGIWPPSPGPITQIQPFTYTDGITYLDILYALKKYIEDTVVPKLNNLSIEVNEAIAELVATINTKLAEYDVQIQAQLAEQNQHVTDQLDAQNTSIANQLSTQNQHVTDQLAAQDADVASKIADMVTYVNDAVATIINNSIQVQDPVMAGIVNNPASQSRAALDAYYNKAQRPIYPLPTNLPALASVRDALLMCRTQRVTITLLADSIGWGVGVDGQASSSTGARGAQQDKYRENAYPYQLSDKLNRRYGTQSSLGFVGPDYSDRVSTWAAGGVAGVGNATLAPFGAGVGPFGNQAGTNKGGAIMQFGGKISWGSDVLTRPFTELDLFVFGDTAGPATPTIRVDGVQVYAGVAITDPVADAWKKVTVTGLTDATHTVEIENTVTGGKSVYGAHLVTRRKNGVVVNRIASSGATSTDAVPSARAITVSVMKNATDLLIIGFSTNDQIQQVPIATYKANLQSLIDAATCPVLLVSGPPVAAPAGALKPADYNNAMLDLVAANSAKVAYAPLGDAMGKYADARDRGMFATNSTVHPSWFGADVISDYLLFVLTHSYQ